MSKNLKKTNGLSALAAETMSPAIPPPSLPESTNPLAGIDISALIRAEIQKALKASVPRETVTPSTPVAKPSWKPASQRTSKPKETNTYDPAKQYTPIHLLSSDTALGAVLDSEGVIQPRFGLAFLSKVDGAWRKEFAFRVPKWIRFLSHSKAAYEFIHANYAALGGE